MSKTFIVPGTLRHPIPDLIEIKPSATEQRVQTMIENATLTKKQVAAADNWSAL